jgi:ubiquinone/menaquinone biosynthesis C-methylase UbiE
MSAAQRRILHVGCGAGQALIAVGRQSLLYSSLPAGDRACGVDVDYRALRLGKRLTNSMNFVCATAGSLPFSGDAFDVVISRVALPSMNVPVALREFARVLRDGGSLWLVLCPAPLVVGQITASPCDPSVAFQTGRGISLALQRAGFSAIKINQDRFFVVAAMKRNDRGKSG